MLSRNALSQLKGMLRIDEGLKQFPYRCTAGKLTLGYGRNIEEKGISEPEASMLLDDDITYFASELEKKLAVFSSLSEERKIALVNMSFMGVKKVLEFKKMIAALERGDYHAAATEMLDSKWAKQVGDRALRLSKIIETGIIN